MKGTIDAYYAAWKNRDRGAVEEILSPDLSFASQWDRYSSAKQFLDDCWGYAEGTQDVEITMSAFEGDKAIVVAKWTNNDGPFVDVTYMEFSNGKISRLTVLAASPDLVPLVG